MVILLSDMATPVALVRTTSLADVAESKRIADRPESYHGKEKISFPLDTGHDSGVDVSDSSNGGSVKHSGSVPDDLDDSLKPIANEHLGMPKSQVTGSNENQTFGYKSRRGSIWNLFKKPLIRARSQSSKWSPSKSQLEVFPSSPTHVGGNLPSTGGKFVSVPDISISGKVESLRPLSLSDEVNSKDIVVPDTPGLTGMHNLGNTCYMNAIVQCLAHIDLVSEYFAMDSYATDINSKDCKKHKRLSVASRSAADGKLMYVFAELIKSLWHSEYYSLDLCRNFHKVVSQYSRDYAGVGQHDAHEFFMWLVDILHEDSTRVAKGKYKSMKKKKNQSEDEQAVLALAAYTQFHRSYIQGLFLSQYRSSIECVSCLKMSSTFDPFTLISLPLPQTDKRPLFLSVVYAMTSAVPVKYGFLLNKGMLGKEFKTKIIYETGLKQNSMILVEVQNDGRQLSVEDESPVGILTTHEDMLYGLQIPDSCFLDISNASKVGLDNDDVVANAVILVVTNVEIRGHEHRRFGPPLALCLSKESSFKNIQLLIRRNMREECKEKLSHVIKSMQTRLGLRVLCSERGVYLSNLVECPLKEESSLKAMTTFAGEHALPVLHVVAEWEPEHSGWHLQQLGLGSFREDVSCTEVRKTFLHRETVQLQDCLKLHTQEEKLQHEDAWTCPTCNTEQKGITRKLSLWSLPDILVLHLKRFDQIHHWNNKMTTLVNFPLHELNMSPHVATTSINNNRGSPSPTNKKYQKASLRLAYQPPPQTQEECIYDLHAVCNHVGVQASSGHYTAFCFNSATGNWYSYDDRKVKALAEAEVVTADAYLLFYVRRKLSSRVPPERCESISKSRSSPVNHWAHQIAVARAKALQQQNQEIKYRHSVNVPSARLAVPMHGDGFHTAPMRFHSVQKEDSTQY